MGRYSLRAALSLCLMGRTLSLALTRALSAAAKDVVSVHIPHLHSYVSASMTVRHSDLSAGYCCNLVCLCAEVNNATAEPCAALQRRFATLSPSLCDSAAHNSSSLPCPPSRAATLCNGGTSCCTDSCNESCTSKLDVCACPCNHCSTCSCCKRVENRLCRLRCSACYKVSMMLDFQDQLGKPHSANFSRNFSLNSSTEAKNFYNAHKGNSSIAALYKLDDPTIVYVNPTSSFVTARYHDDIFLGGLEEYPVGRDWAQFGVMAAYPIFAVSVIVTGMLIALLLQKRRRAEQRPFRIAWSVNRGLWMGIIWPLIIMLLILQVRLPLPRGDTALSILFLQLIVCIGWLPILLLWLYHIIL